MLYSDYLKQQNAALDKQHSGNPNMVKVQDSRFQTGSGWMPKGMADGTNHTKYYNAAQAWRAGGRVGKYTAPDLSKGETQGKIDYSGYKQQSQPSGLSKAPPEKQPATQGTNTGGGGTIKARATTEEPKYIEDYVTNSAVQNAMAGGIANSDLKFLTKSLSRPGFSQGAGQEYRGALQSAQEMSKAATQAGQIESEDQLANSRMKSSYEKARELEGQNYAMSVHQMNQADWAMQFARKQSATQSQMNYLTGMLGIQLALARQ